MAYIPFSCILLLFFFPFHSVITCAHLLSTHNDLKRLHDMHTKCILHIDYLKCNLNFNNQTNKNINFIKHPPKATIKSFQRFYHFNFTRVRNPDSVDGKHKHDHRKDLMCESSFYTFYPGSPRWPGRRIRYAFSRNVEEHVKQPLEHALQRWASVSPLKFYRVKKSAQADIWISFLRGYHVDEFPFDGVNDHVAHEFGPPDGRVHFDAAQNWSISKRDKDGLDMQTFGLHELGHALGLGHSEVRQAIMYPIILRGEIKGLHEDDIKEIKALYNF